MGSLTNADSFRANMSLDLVGDDYDGTNKPVPDDDPME
jgi:hypothetical protein